MSTVCGCLSISHIQLSSLPTLLLADKLLTPPHRVSQIVITQESHSLHSPYSLASQQITKNKTFSVEVTLKPIECNRELYHSDLVFNHPILLYIRDIKSLRLG